MSRLVGDSEYMDHVTILLARVCAARLDPTVKAEDFVRMVARLVDTAVAEALEDVELPHVPASEAKRVEPAICVYCGHRATAPHECDRMRELGLVPDSSSTGVAARASADRSEDSQKAADDTAVAPSIAEPAPPQAEGATRAALSGDGAGTPAAGVSAGAQGSQPRKGSGRRSRFSDDEIAATVTSYYAALTRNLGRRPKGWVEQKAKALGVSVQTIYRWIEAHPPRATNGGKPAKSADIPRFDHSGAMRGGSR